MPTLRSNIKLEGDDKVLKKLKAFIAEADSVAGDILTEAAEMLADEARKLAPGPTGQKYGKYKHPPGTLKKSIQVGEVRRKNGKVTQAVGVTKNSYFSQDDGYYARFQEFGTKDMPASPYMRPAEVKTRPKIRKHVNDKLKEELFK